MFSSCNSKNVKTDSPSTPAASVNSNTTTDSKESKTQESSVEKIKTPKKKSKSLVKNSDANDVSNKNDTVCKSNEDERKLLISTVNEGCKLDYIKNNETKTVATQIIGNKKCEEVFNAIKTKLVAANFNCN